MDRITSLCPWAPSVPPALSARATRSNHAGEGGSSRQRPRSARRRGRLKVSCTAVCLACLAQGCATDPATGQPSFKETFASDDPCSNNARNIGIVGGVLVGAAIGNLSGNGSKKSTLISAAAGGALGGLIGHSMDARHCEIARLSKQYGMEARITPIAFSQPVAAGASAPAGPAPSFKDAVGMSISVLDAGSQFATDSARLSPNSAAYFAKIAEQYSYAKQSDALKQQAAPSNSPEGADVESLKSKRILLIGHTDDTGSSVHNAELAELRAKAVADVFRAAGVPDTQIFYQGAGETLPTADNRSEEGRAQNRRVEIVDLTDEASFKKYLASRTPNLAFYRPAPSVPTARQAGTPQIPAVSRQPNAVVARVPVRPALVPDHAGSAVVSRVTAAPARPGSPQAPTTGLLRGSAAPSGSSARDWIDFGGAPATHQNTGVNVGSIAPEKPGFSLISTANAAGAVVPATCAEDRPRVSRGVKALRDQKDISFTEFVPGLYGTTWSGTLNGNLVAVTNVAVYRDGGQPAARPTVMVYRDFKGNADAKADFKTAAEVNTYHGEKALLYRVFVDGPVQCIDILLPYQNTHRALDSQLFYSKNTQLYVAGFAPTSPQR